MKWQKYFNAVTEIMSPIIDSVHPLYPSKVWDDMSPRFIILFWSLTLYDLEVPVFSYQREIKKLNAANSELGISAEMVNTLAGGGEMCAFWPLFFSVSNNVMVRRRRSNYGKRKKGM